MAERLTKKINKTIQDKYSLGTYLYYDFAEIDDTNKLLNKLGELEDIMEKYGVDIQKLDYILGDYSKNQGRVFAICEERDTLRQERDIWKRACELACEEIDSCDNYGCKTYTIPLEEMLQYFYQQAKKEGENNDTNN